MYIIPKPKAVKFLAFGAKLSRINHMLLFFKAQYRDPILTGEKNAGEIPADAVVLRFRRVDIAANNPD
jgi:hypothetical protein